MRKYNSFKEWKDLTRTTLFNKLIRSLMKRCYWLDKDTCYTFFDYAPIQTIIHIMKKKEFI